MGKESIHIIGASIPRSGHHFLVRILKRLLGNDFFYCEFYTPAACCGKIPCDRRNEFPISFQKNHDIDLCLPIDISDAVYVVQYRDAVSAVLSERELVDQNWGHAIAAHLGHMEVWLAQKIHYYELFFRKWISAAHPCSFIIDYDELKNDTESVITALMGWLGWSVEAEAIRQAVANVVDFRSTHMPFRERSITTSRYFHQYLFEVFESILVDDLDILTDKRRLTAVEYDRTPMYFVYRSIKFRHEGKKSEALRYARHAIELSHDNPMLHQHLGDLLHAMERSKAAQKARRHAQALDPELAAYCELQRRLSKATTPQRFIETVRTATHLAPSNPLFQHHLGQLLLRKGDLAGAEETLRRTLELDRTGGAAQWDLSIALSRTGQLAEAVKWAQSAVALLPAKAQLHHHLGNLLLRQGRLEAAEACQRKAIELEPRLVVAHREMSTILLRRGVTTEAIEAARTAISLEPDHAPSYHNLGNALFHSGDLQAAEAALRTAINLNGGFSQAYRHLSTILHRMGKMDEAIAAAQTATRLLPNNPGFHIQLGKLLFENNDPKGAATALQRALEIDPDLHDAHRQLATVQAARQGRAD